MKKVWVLFAGMFFLSVSLVCSAAPKSLVRLEGLSKKTVVEIGMQGYDVAKCGSNFVEVVVDPDELAVLTKKAGKVKTLIPDMDAYIASIIKKQKEGAEYYTYDRMFATLQKWAAQYSQIAALQSIGKTCEGRDIWALKVSDNPTLDEKEPAVLVMGAHHAREWISFEVVMAALQKYLESYGKDENLTRLINEREVWFVPMLNPDGVIYSQTQSKYWRKNRRGNGTTVYGVDLNRNYGYKWGNVGASDNQSSDTYHGTGPFSEPETQAIKNLYAQVHFQASVSFHSYGEEVLYPFSYACNVPYPDQPILKKLAGEMAGYNGYSAINSADLYPSMGDCDDWGYGDQKALAFTIELAKTFIPNPSEISNVTEKNVPAVFHLIEKAGSYALTTPSGAEALIASLDLTDTLDAIACGSAIQNTYSADYKTAVDDRLLAAGKHAAELVLADLEKGSTEALDRLLATPGADFVMPILRTRIRFERAHGTMLREDLAAHVEMIR